MFIEVNDVQVIEPLTREVVDLARSEKIEKVNINGQAENDEKVDATFDDLIKNISIQTLELIFNSSAVRPEMIQTLFARLPARIEFFDLIISCIQQSMNLQSVILVRKGIETLFSLFNNFKGDDENTKSDKDELLNKGDRVSSIVITVLMFINSQVSEAARDLLAFVHDELLQNDFQCVKSKKIEFQRAIFAFFLNDSREIRQIAKEIAEQSQKLFL